MGIFGGKNPLKRAEKNVKKAWRDAKQLDPVTRTADKMFAKPLEPGIIGLGSGYVDRKIGGIWGQKGRRRVSALQKYAPGKGMDVQLGKDIESVKTYFNPEEPELAPDPQIAEDAEKEAARRRNRAMGRAFLMTSRSPSKLGV